MFVQKFEAKPVRLVAEIQMTIVNIFTPDLRNSILNSVVHSKDHEGQVLVFYLHQISCSVNLIGALTMVKLCLHMYCFIDHMVLRLFGNRYLKYLYSVDVQFLPFG